LLSGGCVLAASPPKAEALVRPLQGALHTMQNVDGQWNAQLFQPPDFTSDVLFMAWALLAPTIRM
jgi:hypothetical protein